MLRVLAVALLLLAAGCGGEAPSPSPGASSVAPPAAPAPGLPAPQPGPGPGEPRLGPYARAQFYLEHDLFIAADDPRTVPAAQASFLREADEVLGLVVGGQARAYPVTMLSYHHVVNDVIEGIPVAVTY